MLYSEYINNGIPEKSMHIDITSLNKVNQHVVDNNTTHVVSLLNKKEINLLNLPETITSNFWLFLEVDDVLSEDEIDAPTKKQIQNLLIWMKHLPENARVTFHCNGGISRSTAAALAAKVQELGVDKIDEAVNWLLTVRPEACPNPVIAKFADEILGANGALFEASEKIANDKILKIMEE